VVLVRGGAEVACWPLWGCGRPDLATVDVLARLQLAARRLGCSIGLRDASVELLELLDLVGLGQALGKAEGSEQAGVDEVVVPHDPPA
jgi:ABC-type transporter Mla MlaB component